MLRRVILALGLAIAAFGALFLLQGLDVVRWPASSFMIGKQVWVDIGSGMVVVGLLMVLIARGLARRQRQREAGPLAGRARD